MWFKQTAAIFEWNSSRLHMHYFKFYCTFLAKFKEPRDFKLAHYLICMVMPLFHSSNSHTIFTRGTRPLVMECSSANPFDNTLEGVRMWTRAPDQIWPEVLTSMVHDVDGLPDRLSSPLIWPALAPSLVTDCFWHEAERRATAPAALSQRACTAHFLFYIA